MSQAAQKFRSFVILGGMRTGSNFLESTLNTVPGLVCQGELFNPLFIGRAGQMVLAGYDLAARDADPLGFLAHLQRNTPGMLGLRLFDDHDARVLAHLLDDPGCAKIVLSRNPLDSFVSLEIARQTGQWRLGHARALKEARIEFSTPAFEDFLRDLQSFHAVIRHHLQSTGQTAFAIDYSDLVNLEILNGLIRWLGLPERLTEVSAAIKPQNPQNLRDKLTNPEVLQTLGRHFDLPNLMRTAYHEPRLIPAPTRIIVSRRLALAYLPLAGGPRLSVATWMGGLIRGGVNQRLSPADFQQWQEQNPGFRSFTMVRHPLLYGWAAFGELLSAKEMASHRRLLERTLKQDLPDPDADALALQMSFLGFLRYVRMTLAGQTGQKPPAQWMAQSDQIEALSRLQPPDLILREETASSGLAFLAAEVGARRRAVYQAEDQGQARLALILNEETALAARQTWPKDYQRFGFQDWMPPQAA